MTRIGGPSTTTLSISPFCTQVVSLSDRVLLLIPRSRVRISLKRRPATLGGAAAAGAPSAAGDIVSLVVGLGLYLAFVFYLHELLIGVPVV